MEWGAEDGDKTLTSSSFPDPTDLVGFSFSMENDGNNYRAEVKEMLPDGKGYLVELLDGSSVIPAQKET